MKSLLPNFWRPKHIVSAGFLAAVAGFFLSLPISPAYAGDIPAPPAWYPFEMEAISLYRYGVDQENSSPAGAVKTLLQARKYSTMAISKGGGGNTAVLHNDELIARALMTAQVDAARKPENNETTETQKSSGQNSRGNNVVKPVAYHAQTHVKVR